MGLPQKMSFNPDPNKQAQGVTFTRKSKIMRHPSVLFNNTEISQSISQKHLRLSFKKYLTKMGAKVKKTIALLRMIQHILPRQALITIYKAFTRPYLD